MIKENITAAFEAEAQSLLIFCEDVVWFKMTLLRFGVSHLKQGLTTQGKLTQFGDSRMKSTPVFCCLLVRFVFSLACLDLSFDCSCFSSIYRRGNFQYQVKRLDSHILWAQLAAFTVFCNTVVVILQYKVSLSFSVFIPWCFSDWCCQHPQFVSLVGVLFGTIQENQNGIVSKNNKM